MFVFKVHVSCRVRFVLGKDFRVRVVFVFKVHVSCRVRLKLQGVLLLILYNTCGEQVIV